MLPARTIVGESCVLEEKVPGLQQTFANRPDASNATRESRSDSTHTSKNRRFG